ncbi:interferon-induced 6-16 family protein [Nitzschia inconspicua]|uniref:Interferon-induced 6-16 family protein n=1 Tax=Nitzschia inconspicua TaxID=303405 RepID=A0A9K3PT78_9STRA|nr:interferon-induced 6-16 family protein [Nitzschia inconspicua]
MKNEGITVNDYLLIKECPNSANIPCKEQDASRLTDHNVVVQTNEVEALVDLDVNTEEKKGVVGHVFNGVVGVVGHALGGLRDHPELSLGIPLAIGGIGLVATAAGFGAAGVIGGSLAASIQSGIGNVAAGSAFATMQSLGATGTFSAMTTGGLAASAGSVAAIVTKKKNKDEARDVNKTHQTKDCTESANEG